MQLKKFQGKQKTEPADASPTVESTVESPTIEETVASPNEELVPTPLEESIKTPVSTRIEVNNVDTLTSQIKQLELDKKSLVR